LAQTSDGTGAPWLWMDVSTSYRAQSGQMNGTLRVEQSYIRALTALMGPTLRFCRYDPLRQDYVALAAPPDLGGKPVAGKSKKKEASGIAATIKPIGKTIERSVKTAVRGAIAPLFGKVGAEPLPQLGGAGVQEVLFLAGENWSRVGFDAVARMRQARGTKVAVLCQDMIPAVAPQFFAGGDFVAKFDAYARFLISEADLVISISDATRRDILDYATRHGGMRGTVEVVHLGADADAARTPRRPQALSQMQADRFVVSVSTIQSRKNFDLLYHLWRRLTAQNTPGLPTLIIVGQPGFGSADLLWQIAHDPITAQSIVHLPHAGDDELAWLYQHCLFTLYPSFHEGWGLPVSESLAFGKYCIASDVSSLPEAGAGMARHIDPLDFAAWRDAVLDLIGDPAQLDHHESTIRACYHPVTWEQSAARLSDVLRSLATRSTGHKK
jgi:glycosyltransferase involved in cell wall biosynthesis